MGAGLDKISESLKQHKTSILLIAAAASMAENKWKAIAETIKSIALIKLVGVTGLLAGAFIGIRGVIRNIVKDTGSLEAAIRRMSEMRGMERQWSALLGGASKARERIGELVKFVQNNPIFSTGSANLAARSFQIIARGAVGFKDGMKLAGDAAKASGSDIADTADVLATLHRQLQDGSSIEGTVGQLEGLGLVSSGAARAIVNLQQSGAGVATVFGAVQAEVQRNSAAAAGLGDTVEELQKKLDDASNAMQAKFGQPFLDGEKAGMESAIKVANNLAPVMETLGKTFATVVDTGASFGHWLKEVITGIPGLSSASVAKTWRDHSAIAS